MYLLCHASKTMPMRTRSLILLTRWIVRTKLQCVVPLDSIMCVNTSLAQRWTHISTTSFHLSFRIFTKHCILLCHPSTLLRLRWRINRCSHLCVTSRTKYFTCSMGLYAPEVICSWGIGQLLSLLDTTTRAISSRPPNRCEECSQAVLEFKVLTSSHHDCGKLIVTGEVFNNGPAPSDAEKDLNVRGVLMPRLGWDVFWMPGFQLRPPLDYH